MTHVRTRFAPSPTGFVHVGSLRAALYPYLFAKKNKGTFIVRVEDTDQERLVEGAVENMVKVLTWAGVSIDEGPVFHGNTITQKGNHGPYIQSERLHIYKKYAQELIDKGAAYYAFDTGEELEAMRKRQELLKLPPKYDRMNMRNSFTLSKEEAESLVKSNVPFVIRLKVPDREDVSFEDVVRGKVTVNTKEIDDQVLMKSDGFPTYHLAVVVDDHLMEITHVIRGEDWLPSTPKHILLYRAFGWTIPVHAHMPLLVSMDRKKLSKRKGDVSVESYIEKGYLPQAFINFLAFLGWNPGTDQEVFSHDELIDAFTLERIQSAPAVFNMEKLDWYNKEYMKRMSPKDLVELAYPFFVSSELCSGSDEKRDEEKALLLRLLPLAKERATTLLDLPLAVKFLFSETITYDPNLLVWKKSTKEETLAKLEALYKVCSAIDPQFWDKASLEASLMLWIKDNGFGNGDVLWPMRVALSGEQHSPGPFDLADFLGKDKSIERLKQAIVGLGGTV